MDVGNQMLYSWREFLENQNFSLLSNVPFLGLFSSFYGHDFWHIIIFSWIFPHIKLVLRYIKFVTKIPLLEFPYFFEKAHKGMARNEMLSIKRVFPVLLRLHWIHPSENCRLAAGRLLFFFLFFCFVFLPFGFLQKRRWSCIKTYFLQHRQVSIASFVFLLFLWVFNNLRHHLQILRDWQTLNAWTLAVFTTFTSLSHRLACYKSTSHKFLKVNEASFNAWGRTATERAGDEVWRSTCFAWMDLSHIYNFMPGKKNWHMVCWERGEISLTVLLVNCHDLTGWIFDRWISRQTGTKSPFKCEPTRKKINDL